MPKYTETARREIKRAEAAYTHGQASQGVEILEIANARTLVHLVEVLDRIEKHLARLAPAEGGAPLKLEANSRPAKVRKPSIMA